MHLPALHLSNCKAKRDGRNNIFIRGIKADQHAALVKLTFFSFFLILQDNEEHSYSTLKSKNTSARVSGLKPGTKYIFQVRARTSAGVGRFSQNVEIQTGKAGACACLCANGVCLQTKKPFGGCLKRWKKSSEKAVGCAARLDA